MIVRKAAMDGFLLVDKPVGMSSFDVIRRLNRHFMIGRSGRKIGHGGTLDPMASGLMVIAIGKATRLLPYFLGSGKRYTAQVRLGERTTTDDAEGEVILRRDATHISPDDILKILPRFEGRQMQVPPAFSALHIDGVRAYKLARQGKAVVMPEREIEVSKVAYVASESLSLPEFSIDVECSGGTYIRSLARDIGEALGCGAHLTGLRRTGACHFSIASALSLEFLLAQDDIDAHLTPCMEGMSFYPQIEVSLQTIEHLFKGQPVRIDAPGDGIYRITALGSEQLSAILTRTEGKDKFLRLSPCADG